MTNTCGQPVGSLCHEFTEEGELHNFEFDVGVDEFHISNRGEEGVYFKIEDTPEIGGEDSMYVPPKKSISMRSDEKVYSIEAIAKGATLVYVEGFVYSADVIDEVKTMMGFPTVEIAMERDSIQTIINKAFREVKEFITEFRYVTLPYQDIVDVTDYNMYYIMDVYKSHVTDITELYDEFYIPTFMAAPQKMFWLDDITEFLLRRQIIHTLKEKVGYRLVKSHESDKDGDYLYIDMAPPIPASFTVLYCPDFKSVDDLKEPFWRNLVIRLATAYAKQVEGTIRSKYKIGNLPYEIDGNDLRKEGQDEEKTIREEIDEGTYVFYPL